jgi:integrase/recombinase XerD
MRDIEPRDSATSVNETAPNDAALVVTSLREKTRKARGSVPDLRRILPGEVAKAIEAAGRHGDLIRFLWVTGARLSEVVGQKGVTVRQIDFASATARIRTLKRRGAHYRAVPLPTAMLGQLVQRIHAEKLGPDERLFPFSRQHAYQVIRAALLAAGVDPHRARPHALRHGHAFHVLAAGAPVTTVQRALGHSTPLTTTIYLAASGADVRAAYAKVDFG